MQVAEGPRQLLRQGDIATDLHKAQHLTPASVLLGDSSQPDNRILARLRWVELEQFVSVGLGDDLSRWGITLAKVR